MSEIKLSDKVVWLRTDDIKPYWRNPRDNSDAIAPLIEAIKTVGFNVPIVVDKENVIVKGHSRYSAAIQLGMKTIPCIISENTDKQNRADRIIDNKIQDYSWYIKDVLDEEIASFSAKAQVMFDSIMMGGIDDALDDFVLPVEPGEVYVDEQAEQEFEELPEEEKDKVFVKYMSFSCPYCGHENKIRME